MNKIGGNMRAWLHMGLCLAAAGAAAMAGATDSSGPQLQIVDKIVKARPANRPGNKDLSAYLLVYFKDDTHSVHFAVSEDGYSFTDINAGRPVLNGRAIAEQHGIRDPYIMRGPDGAFYMAMTDLHIRAQAEGLRTTEWERPKADYGWGNNRSLIFMKSYDLVHWTHHIVHVEGAWPSTRDIGTAWAPEMIYDPARKKIMVYYTTRHKDETLHMVYSYADDAFTKLTDEPRDLFTFPKPGVATLDGDITKVGSRYYLFYGSNEPPAPILKAVSNRINGGFVYDPAKVNADPVDTEAPMVWRRYGTKSYMVMYDAFGTKPQGEMGFSETTDFVHFRRLGVFNEPGSPMKATNFSQAKHGAVISISPKEAAALRAHFSVEK